jgi:chorismate dehydratase
MKKQFTLGVVSYLNALPLYRTLETRGEVKVLRAVPSQLAPMLQSGECDAAIMPVVDYFRGVGSRIISDACIGTKIQGEGAVRSVLLFYRAPLDQLQSVAVDASSHTSVALTRVLLADAYGITPPFLEHEPNLAQMLQKHEAALLIGDAALEAKNAVEVSIDDPEDHILDLGAAWKKLTGLPFVFAPWIAREGLSGEETAELSVILSAARDEGVNQIGKIARERPLQTTLPTWQIEEYLRDAVEFHLSPQHERAIEEFRHRCELHKLLT